MAPTPRADEIAALKAEIQQTLNEDPVNQEWCLEKIDRLAWSVGSGLYSGALLLLYNILFEEEEAENHWKSIQTHRASMEESLGRTVALRVATLDYLIGLNIGTPRARLLEVLQAHRPSQQEMTDPVTALHTAAFFNDQLPREVGRARRFDLDLSLIHVEIDDYAGITEQFGQSIGTTLLKEVAGILDTCLRDMDYAARISASEFALLLTETDRMGAYYVADRIRQQIEAFYLERQIGGFPLEVSVSSGVAAFPQDADDAESLVRKAVSAFHHARARGHGGVAIHHRERREYLRLESENEDLQVSIMPEGEASELAQMKNISSGGVLFESETPIELGRMVQIICHNRREGDEVLIPGRVVRIERFEGDEGERYEVGVLFDLVVEEQLEGVIGFLERFISTGDADPDNAESLDPSRPF